MSVYCVINQTMRLSDPTRKVILNEPLAYSNTRAHAFRVTVLAEGSSEPADLSSVGCVGQFYKMKANETVMPINGTVNAETGVAEIILPASCYTTPGRFTFTMDLTQAVNPTGYSEFSASTAYEKGDMVVYNGVVYMFTADHSAGAWTGTDAVLAADTRTALWVEGIVERTTGGDIIDPGTPVGNIEQAIGNANAAAATATQAASAANQSASDANTAASEARAASAVSVRYDTAQTLTATEQAQARENIGAASGARTDLMHIVEEGYPVTAYGADYSTASYGVTYTKIGNRLTLNGTNNFGGSADRYYAFGTGSPLFSGTTGWAGVTDAYLNTGFVLKAGVAYKLTMRVLSGSTTSPGTAARLQFYFKNADGTGSMGGSSAMTIGSTFPQELVWTYTPADDKILGYGLIMYPKIVFSNLVIEYAVVEADVDTEARAGVLEVATQLSDRVKLTEQTLTEAEKAQARENIGAASKADERGRDGLITYRTEAFDLAEVPGATNATCIGAESTGEIVTLNGTNNASSAVYIRLTGAGTRTASVSTVRGWTGALTIPSGRVCKLTMRLLSGTVDGAATVSVYKSGTSSTLGQAQRHNGLYSRVWVSDGAPVSIAVWISQGTTLTAATYSIIIEDITDGQFGLFVPVDGTTVSIDAAPGVRYECGTVNELTFTPSASGLCEVVFTTGSNPTEPVLPSTVRMPDWWTGVEANRTYDLMILNGTLAGVMSWAT